MSGAAPSRVLHIQKATGIAGAETHLLELLARLDRAVAQPHFLLLVEDEAQVADYKRRLEQIDVPVATVRIRRDVDPVCLWDTIRFLRRGSFRMVHTHLIHGDLYGTIGARIAGVPRVLASKHGYEDFEKTSIFYRLNGALQRYVDRVITISEALQDKVSRAEGISKSKMLTIHYGLDVVEASPEAGSRIRTELGIDERQFVIACVGRLVPVKGFQYLIEAAPGLKTRVADPVIVIAGEGPLHDALAREIGERRLNGTVRLLGWRRDVRDILAASDVFVMPSLGEGFGLVLLEAMAQRKPVVASAVMSIPEIVRHGATGLLVKPADVGGLVEAITALAESPAIRRRMGDAGQERVRQQFSVDAMVAKTEGVYRELLGVA